MTETDKPTGISLPSSEQFYLNNARGEQYLIQISWPLHWNQHEPDTDRTHLPVIYIVDGNALFLTATEALWRRPVDPHYAGGGIIVAIGYPLADTGKVFHLSRRSFDLTPPADKPVEGCGGADIFLDFIRDSVRPAVKERFPKVSISREALYGHSFGGLFALHALFTRPGMFDAYIASSPSIWWNERGILDEGRGFVGKIKEDKVEGVREKLPTLMMYLGGLEQDPRRRDDEPDDKWQDRQRMAEMFNMRNNVRELVDLIKGARLHMSFDEYAGEDHGTVVACSMSRGLTTFMEWPVLRNKD